MAVGISPGELRELTDEELTERLRESKEELFNLRFQMATGQLTNNRRLRTVRHEIARVYTVLRERELGLARGPDGDGIRNRDGRSSVEGRPQEGRCRRMAASKDKGPKHTPATPKPRGRRKTRIGYVVSDKMQKTIVVELEDRMRHPLYGKIIRTTKKVKAHDENSTAGIGDRVVADGDAPDVGDQALAPGRDLREGQVSGQVAPKRQRNARDLEVSGVSLCRAWGHRPLARCRRHARK